MSSSSLHPRLLKAQESVDELGRLIEKVKHHNSDTLALLLLQERNKKLVHSTGRGQGAVSKSHDSRPLWGHIVEVRARGPCPEQAVRILGGSLDDVLGGSIVLPLNVLRGIRASRRERLIVILDVSRQVLLCVVGQDNVWAVVRPQTRREVKTRQRVCV